MQPNLIFHKTKSESFDFDQTGKVPNPVESNFCLEPDRGEQKTVVHKKYYSLTASELVFDDSLDMSIIPYRSLALQLRSLNKIFGKYLMAWWTRWKTNAKGNKTLKLNNMVAVLVKIFRKTGKRVFDPPRVIKDADEIMRRTIKKLIQIKFRLFESAFARWKFMKLSLVVKEKAVTFYRACQVAGHLFKDAFYEWRFKTKSHEPVKRTAATSKFQKVLSKAFRARFKLFVFSTYFKMGPKKAVGLAVALMLKKGVENKRLGIERLRAFAREGRRKDRQIRRDRKLVKLMANFKKVLELQLRRGWRSFNRPIGDKRKLLRLIIKRLNLKKRISWDKLKELTVKNFKSFGYKLQGVMLKVARKRQRFGFRVFLPAKFCVVPLHCFAGLYKNFISFGFVRIQLKAKSYQIEHIKEKTKSIRKNHKSVILRSRKLTGKNLKFLSVLVKKYFKVLVSFSENNRTKKISLKLFSKHLLKKPKQALVYWKEFSAHLTSLLIRAQMNSGKLKVIMYKIPNRTLKYSYKLMIERREQVKVATRVFTRQLGKKPKLVLTKWTKTIDLINHGLLFDACRSQKLKESLWKIIKFYMKDKFWRVCARPVNLLLVLKNVFKFYANKLKFVFGEWRSLLLNEKNQKVLLSLKGINIKKIVYKILHRTVLSSLIQIKASNSKAIKKLKLFFASYNERALSYLVHWKNTSFKEKSRTRLNMIYGKLLKNVLKNLFFIVMKPLKKKLKVWKEGTLAMQFSNKFLKFQAKGLKSCSIRIIKTAFSHLIKRIFRPSPLRKFSNIWIQHCRGTLKSTFNSWEKYVEKCKKGELLDAFRSEKLRKRLESINKRSLRDSIDRVLGDGNKTRGHLRRIIMAVQKSLYLGFSEWKNCVTRKRSKEVYIKLKALSLRSHLKLLLERQLRSSVERVIGNGKRAFGQILRILSHFKYKYLSCFSTWKNKIQKIKEMDAKRSLKVIIYFANSIKKILRTGFEAITGDRRIRLAITKMIDSYKHLQREVISRLKSRSEKIKIIRKINCSYIITRNLTSYFKRSKKNRFIFWKNLDALKKKRILRKSVWKFIQNMSINYESAFWKWIIIRTQDGKLVFPRHSIFLKRLIAVSSSYKKRLEQFALFKLVLNYKSNQLVQSVTFPKAIANIIKYKESEKNIHYRDFSQTDLDKEKIAQLGALEILFIVLNGAKIKKFSWIFSALHISTRYINCLDDERENFKYKLAELRYERQSLLEDNNILRDHNEKLITNLEKNTEELQELSFNMDFLRINSMFRIFIRILLVNLMTGFYKLSNISL